MRENQEYGAKNPHRTLVALATDSTCPICGEKPCTLLTTASILVLEASMVETTVSAINYGEGLKNLHRHLRGHRFGVSHRLWEANRTHISEDNNPQRKELTASNGHLYADNEDPPDLN